MKILVTGAAGLIGSHLCDILVDKGYQVVGVDNLSFGNKNNIPSGVNFVKCNVESINDVCGELSIYKPFDIIFHLASYKKVWDGSVKSSDVMNINFNMTKAIVDKCLIDNSKLIFTSTSDIYGNSNTFLESDDITMGAPTNIRYSYALSKWHSEQYILNEIKESSLRASIVRVFGCASKRSNSSWSGGHVPLFVKQAIDNQNIIIHGDGLQTRSISHAKDIAQGIFDTNFIDNEIINIGTDEETTVKEIAEYIINKTNSKSKLIYKTKDEIFGNYKEIQRRFANTTKAKQLINYKLNYTTYDVVDEIIRSYK